jgi:hypothetical protein
MDTIPTHVTAERGSRIQNTNALATEWVVVSEWSPVAGQEGTGGLCYEDYTDQRKAEDAFHDYVRGEYSRARAVCIFASRNGVPIGRIA